MEYLSAIHMDALTYMVVSNFVPNTLLQIIVESANIFSFLYSKNALIYLFLGGRVEDLPNIDGVNQWPSLVSNFPSPRKRVLLNIDEALQVASLRIDTPKYQWKLVLGEFLTLLI